MAGRSSFARITMTLFVAVLLVLGGSTSSAAATRERYEPPAATTVTPDVTADQSLDPIEIEFEPNGGFQSAATGVPGGVISAPAVDEVAAPQTNVRPRPDSRPFELATATRATEVATATEAPAGPIRLDEPVLRWLPEILAAAEVSGTPAHIIAGVMRLESNGNPNIISPVGARGQMQIMPSNLIAMGVPEYLWHDPATNIMAGGRFLASRAAEQGSWEGAVGAYFGFGCDVFGTCTETYIAVAMNWAYFYLPAIENPLSSGFGVLPADWVAPPIVPFVEAAPPKVETPPATTPAPDASTTPVSGASPTNPAVTPVPTGVPTVAPTPVPTEAPVLVPTAAPTEPPIEVPTEAPAAPPVVEESTPPPG